MFIADELEKFLVCEICFENFNESHRCPMSLFPCGHTFCQSCIKNLSVKKCPECNSEFEMIAKNWSLLNLVPKPKIADNYASVRELVSLANDLLKKFEKITLWWGGGLSPIVRSQLL